MAFFATKGGMLLNLMNIKGVIIIYQYSVVFEEEDFIYVNLLHNDENIRIPIDEYEEWKKDKMEY